MALHPSIRIEGGLLGPDLVDQILAGELPGQRAADFGLEARRNLTDEIAAAFADARALWGVFQRRLDRLAADDLATSATRDAWVIPFLGLLGYDLRYNQRAYEIDGLSFAISHRAGEAEHAPPVHIVGIRQELGRVPASGRPRLAPHSLVQEYLNRTEQLWGVVTNGQTLRLLRDSTFVRRQAYVEFDLPAMLDEQRFQDFAALYRLLHRTRFAQGPDDANECLLERYYLHSVEQGGRVREHLREGVEDCLKLLGNGFLSHPANEELRRRVAVDYTGNDRITAEGFYRQLLILVYRFLFLLVSEDRGLLSAEPIYRDHYSIGRLRRMLDQRTAFNEYDDLWQSLRVLWLVLIKDQPQPALGNQPMASALGLQVLNGDLFAPLALDGCTLSNADLLRAVWHLAWYQESQTSSPRRVNYAALDVEELGSVYESLLELHPAIDSVDTARPGFSFVAGSERKATGSYYTPPELVSELITSAIDPVIAERLGGASDSAGKQRALLSIRVCDPACGSGHFLLAAARRLGKELARVRTGEDEPAPERVREAIRDVTSHCIYGVDKNPLAVDLCRVALWIESHTADRPLTFLDHRIRCGDSLVGVLNIQILREGIPDEAFQPLDGDDKETAKRLKAANRAERQDVISGQRGLNFDGQNESADWARHSRELDQIADDSPELIRRKKELFERSHRDAAWLRLKQACDLWTAAFFQIKKPDTPAITTAALSAHNAGRSIAPQVAAIAGTISSRQRFFHWPLEFPEVFADGGFDVMLGNPPWGSELSGGASYFCKHTFARIIVRMVDSYMYFAYFMVLNTRARGRTGVVLPDAVLYQTDTQRLRQEFFEHGEVSRIVNAGDVFEDVSRPAAMLTIVRERLGSPVEISDWRKAVPVNFTVSPSQLFNYPGTVFATTSAEAFSILEKILSRPHVTLGELIDDDGIQRGVSPDLKDAFVVDGDKAKLNRLEVSHLRPVLTGGRDIKQFRVLTSEKVLVYTTRDEDFENLPHIREYIDRFAARITCKEVKEGKHPLYALHRPREKHIFEKAVKVVGVITGDSIIVAIDEQMRYATDAVYLFGTKAGVDPFYVVGLLNSALFTFLYGLYAPESDRVFAQVKPTVLETLPIPIQSESTGSVQQDIARLSHEMHSRESISVHDLRQLDDLVSSLFQLDQAECQYYRSLVVN